MNQDTQATVKTSLKTLHNNLQEISSILNKPIDQLEYLNEGNTPKETASENPVSENPTITLQMLLDMANEISRKSSHIAKQTNILTGQ